MGKETFYWACPKAVCIIKPVVYIEQESPCLTTFSSTKKSVENMMCSEVFFVWTFRCLDIWSNTILSD